MENAAAEFEKLKAMESKFSYDLHQEPWGQKRFSILDPNRLFIDIVQQVEPQAHWWDQYMN